MSVVDAHVHVWDAEALDYPWLADAPGLPRRALPTDIDRADGAVARMVFVEADRRADQAAAEARWVAALDWPELAGVVAHADLARPGTIDEVAGLPGVVGVRDLLQDRRAETWDAAALAEGLAELAGRGLTFDACVRHAQLPVLADLLERSPATRVVLDHLGKPPVDEGLRSTAGAAWTAAIGRIAALPSTVVKLSGLAAETSDAASFARNADAFVAAALDAFGPARAMIGSDWPVSARSGVGTTTRDWIDRVRRATGAAGAEWDDIAAGTATRFYGLR